MNLTTLDERLTALGHHLDDERTHRNDELGSTDESSVSLIQPASAGTTDEVRVGFRPVRPAALTLVAAAFVAALTIGGAWLALRSPAATVEAADAGPPPAARADGSVPGSLSPFLEEPPAWFGEPRPGLRPAGHFQGRWTSLAIGITDGENSVREPIVISVTDGSSSGLDDVPPAVFGDRELRLQTGDNDWAVLATTDQPTLIVAGPADVDLLRQVLDSVEFIDDGEALRLHLDELPAGYTTVVDQQVRAADVADRRTLISADGLTVVNEVSEWVRADLAAAASGSEYTTVPVGDVIGYSGVTVSTDFGPMTFLIWSPAPGVVLEVGTADPSVELSQLVELATAVTLLPVEEWDERLNP